jgi:hypothetical protein
MVIISNISIENGVRTEVKGAESIEGVIEGHIFLKMRAIGVLYHKSPVI